MAIQFQAMESEHEIRPIDRSGASASVSDKSGINISDSAERSQEKRSQGIYSDSAEQSQQRRVEDDISEAVDSGESGGGGEDKARRGQSNAGAEAAAVSDFDRMAPPPDLGMERPEGYDPQRIPLSIFETSKSAAPADWSVASNESLFSIHVGSCSFSADHGVLADELSKPEDLALEEGLERQSFEAGEDGSRLSAGVSKPALLSLSSSHSLISEGSESSALSFAFPILPGSIYINEPEKSENDIIKRHKSSPTKTSKPISPTNKWFWCLPCTTCSCFSWCSGPRNCCRCNCRRHFCCFYCCC